MSTSESSGRIKNLLGPIIRVFGNDGHNEKNLNVFLDGEIEAVEKYIGYVMAKQKALLKHETPSGKLYEISSKKDKVEVTTNLKPANGKVAVSIRIEGYREDTRLVYDRIASEIKHFKGV